ncbi:GFA family protein [Marinicella meishanensis]|uniref:GFA family protein n=1 Tax=Marinicella meishanensis TaxID=2873263 RepID=UPI001CBD71DF|nr:GFA family protein [Marinicella sp. NBU2979]
MTSTTEQLPLAAEYACQCACGHVQYTVQGLPLFRMVCHCGICQKYNQASHADVLIYRTDRVQNPPADAVRFSTYKRPPNVQRGCCEQCGQAVIEEFYFPLMPKLTMVPVRVFPATDSLPEPSGHMFYESRVQEATDDRPKLHGFWRSQWAFFKFWWRHRRPESKG